MKKNINKKLVLMIGTVILVILMLNMFIQKYYAMYQLKINVQLSKEQIATILMQNAKFNIGLLCVNMFVLACMIMFLCMRMWKRFVMQDANQMTDNVRKITKILDTVDMLLAVYEYGSESDEVFAAGKIGQVFMLSEEEISALLKDKNLFACKIDEVKQYPVKGYKKVYRLPVETDCFLRIETFKKDQMEFGVVLDVTEEIIEKQRLLRERDYDLLTGLLSRRAFYQKMKDLYQKPQQIKSAVLMMFDLDGLKKFNDTYGHANGDKAIKKVAEIITCIPDKNCFSARLSGDEFAIFIYGEENDGILEDKIKEIYNYMLNAQIEIYGQNIDVRLSGGYVFYSKYPEELDRLLKKADEAMYVSKESGRARFTEFNEKLVSMQTRHHI